MKEVKNVYLVEKCLYTNKELIKLPKNAYTLIIYKDKENKWVDLMGEEISMPIFKDDKPLYSENINDYTECLLLTNKLSFGPKTSILDLHRFIIDNNKRYFYDRHISIDFLGYNKNKWYRYLKNVDEYNKNINDEVIKEYKNKKIKNY